MRWKEPCSGDTKIKRKFALFPIKINKDIRWLEWVNIKYRYYEGNIFKDPIVYKNHLYRGWKQEEFID